MSTSDFKFIGELPKSDKPWQLASFSGRVIAVNPDHPPQVIEGGKIRPIEFDGNEIEAVWFNEAHIFEGPLTSQILERGKAALQGDQE